MPMTGNSSVQENLKNQHKELLSKSALINFPILLMMISYLQLLWNTRIMNSINHMKASFVVTPSCMKKRNISHLWTDPFSTYTHPKLNFPIRLMMNPYLQLLWNTIIMNTICPMKASFQVTLNRKMTRTFATLWKVPCPHNIFRTGLETGEKSV